MEIWPQLGYDVSYLVIAGGGGGGSPGGGGGAGGYRNSFASETPGGPSASTESQIFLTGGNHDITVGAGGTAGPNSAPGNTDGTEMVMIQYF